MRLPLAARRRGGNGIARHRRRRRLRSRLSPLRARDGLRPRLLRLRGLRLLRGHTYTAPCTWFGSTYAY